METSRQLLSLALSAVNGQCAIDVAFEKLEEVVSKNRCALGLLDVLNSIDVEVGINEEDDRKQRLRELLRKCSGTLIPEEVMVHSIASLEDSRAKTRIVRLKTKLLYKQTKFNLLHEESEGFILLFNTLIHSSYDARNIGNVCDCVFHLTAEYSLDPRRVYDLILHCFEFHVEQYAFFIDLLRGLEADADMLNYVITLRLSSADPKQADANNSRAEGFNANLPSFFDMVAILVYHDLADLSFLLSNMLPSIDEMKAELADAMEKARSGKGDMGLIVHIETENSFHSSGDDSLLDEGEIDTNTSLLDQNYKILFLHSLIKIGHWKAAKVLLDHMPANYISRYVDVGVAVCDFVSYLIEPFYMSVSDHVATESTQFPENRPYMAVEKRCETLSEFISDIFPILLCCGPCFMCDVVTFVKVIRLCRSFMAEANEDEDKFANEVSTLLAICCTTLLPSLTLIPSNCSASEEMWFLLRHFPFGIRHTLYNEWGNSESADPLLLEKRREMLSQTRYFLKRLSKETVKHSARLVGRLCHSYPVVVLDLILSQVQQFENLVEPVVESLRHLTSLSYDVLSYIILMQISNPDKQRLKMSDASVASWLQTLCAFTGSIFKKYNIDIECLLQYVCHQLLLDNSVDLLILYEVVKSMSGIQSSSGVVTDRQLEAYCGGNYLKAEYGFIARGRSMKRSVSRLKRAIMQKDLIVNLCVRMAARRPRIVYSEAIMDVKVAGHMYDQCQDTFIQFVSFLVLFVEPKDYMKRIPLFPELIENCNLDIDVAMFLARPIYSCMIEEKYGALLKADDSSNAWSIEKKVECYMAVCSEVLDPLAEVIPSLFPPDLLENLSPKFFVLFWTLSAGDIYVPSESYKATTDRIRRLIERSAKPSSSEDFMSNREKSKCEGRLADLTEEHQHQLDHVALVKETLMMEKDLHIPDDGVTEFISSFIANCVYQRCIFSDMDSIFCHKFIETLHFIKEFNFPTMAFYDMLFSDIAPLVLSFSEFEANRFGRFLASTFDMLLRWHVDAETYEKECSQHPGFHIGIMWDTVEEEAEWLSHDNYRALLYTWQFRITRSMITCLMEESFVSVRNALLILTKMLPVFPRVKSIASALASEAVKIQSSQKSVRPDLSVLAASYLGRLKLLEKQLVSTPVFIPAQEDSISLSSSGELHLDKSSEADSTIDSVHADVKRPSEAKATGRSRRQRSASTEGGPTANGTPSTSAEPTGRLSSTPVSQPSLQKKPIKCPPVKLLPRKTDSALPSSTTTSTVSATESDRPERPASSRRDSPSSPKPDSDSSTTAGGSRSKIRRTHDRTRKDTDESSRVAKEASSKTEKHGIAPDESRRRLQASSASELPQKSADSTPVKLKKPVDIPDKAKPEAVQQKSDQREEAKPTPEDAKQQADQAESGKETTANRPTFLRKRQMLENSVQDDTSKSGGTIAATSPGELKEDKDERIASEVFPIPRLRIRSQKPVTSRSEEKSPLPDKTRRARTKRPSQDSVKVIEASDQSLLLADTLDQFIVVDTSNSGNEEVGTTSKSAPFHEVSDLPSEKEKSGTAVKEGDSDRQSALNDEKPVELATHENISFASSSGEYDNKRKRRKVDSREAKGTEPPPDRRDPMSSSKASSSSRMRPHPQRPKNGGFSTASAVSKQQSDEAKTEKRSRPGSSGSEDKRKRSDTKFQRAERSSDKSTSQKAFRRISPDSRVSHRGSSGRGRVCTGDHRPRERAEHYARGFRPYMPELVYEIPFNAFEEQNEMRYSRARESDLYMQPEGGDRSWLKHVFCFILPLCSIQCGNVAARLVTLSHSLLVIGRPVKDYALVGFRFVKMAVIVNCSQRLNT
uniref:THO complex subunit 2 n=1 Tax=Trichuris muris TaxID=70415 RepID=A0A5S6QQM4_TRIMR